MNDNTLLRLAVKYCNAPKKALILTVWRNKFSIPFCDWQFFVAACNFCLKQNIYNLFKGGRLKVNSLTIL